MINTMASSSMESLPTEILIKLFIEADVGDVRSLMLVSKKMYKIFCSSHNLIAKEQIIGNLKGHDYKLAVITLESTRASLVDKACVETFFQQVVERTDWPLERFQIGAAIRIPDLVRAMTAYARPYMSKPQTSLRERQLERCYCFREIWFRLFSRWSVRSEDGFYARFWINFPPEGDIEPTLEWLFAEDGK
ncbi:hypothetical protein F5Y15DRAFT_429866 [Xylariaceae sp. FL0016]|nr:hypothetical protein F5Y15DRAFT_429866 [Xylariaceae sp. FL0016]